MTITVSEEISASRECIWNIITDIDTWADTISGIVSIEVINRPEAGIVGLKWREKRVLFGRDVVETMWVSAAEPNSWYEEYGAHLSRSNYSIWDGSIKS